MSEDAVDFVVFVVVHVVVACGVAFCDEWVAIELASVSSVANVVVAIARLSLAACCQ